MNNTSNTTENWKTKIRDKYWELKWWVKSSSFGVWWEYKIEHPYLYPMRCIFNPRHKKLRKSIPRVWSDSTELIREVNFAIITEFYTDEFVSGNIDWNYNKAHRDFAKWLKNAYKYITIERPELDKQMLAAYPKIPKGVDTLKWLNEPHSYKERYGEVNRIEKLINKKDKEILIGLTNHREMFWT
ncbi:MAG: hypothetical protein AABY22_25425 [Nanoarchaeota archaeon]